MSEFRRPSTPDLARGAGAARCVVTTSWVENVGWERMGRWAGSRMGRPYTPGCVRERGFVYNCFIWLLFEGGKRCFHGYIIGLSDPTKRF